VSWKLLLIAAAVGKVGRAAAAAEPAAPPRRQGGRALLVRGGSVAMRGRGGGGETPLPRSDVAFCFSHCLGPVRALDLSYRDHRGSSKKRAGLCRGGRGGRGRNSHRLRASSPVTQCVRCKLERDKICTFPTPPLPPRLLLLTPMTGTQGGLPCRRMWCWSCP